TVWVDYDVHERHVILVKLMEGTAVFLENGTLSTSADQTLPAGTWTSVFDIAPATLDNWQETAVTNTGEPVPNLGLYFHVTLPAGVEAAEAIPEFWASPLVEGAYPVDLPIRPPLPPDYETSNPGNFNTQSGVNIYQRYLDSAADGGMDVRYAWEGTGGRGDGIDICDVEYGYNPHADLPAIIQLALPAKIYTNDFYEHGTAVLGMLGGKDNGWGVTGMVTEARLLFSPVTPFNGSFNIANAITRCIDNLNAGDVILLEQQAAGRNGNFVPSEWDPAVYAAIKTAVGKKITVVEAAGNGSEDLDHVFYQTAKPGHTPFTAAKDSGAIIVGSAKSIWTATPRAWNDGSSTYGSTVDLQGWGMHILAPGYGNYYNDEGSSLSYTLFSGTSGASPMVTAAVAIVQANNIAKNGSPATPAQVKQLLQNTGSSQADEGDEHIGPFPNLRAAINDIWNLPEPAAPVIMPVGGAYDMPLQVTIDYGNASQNSSNTHLRYTLDGSEPTFDSYIYIPEFGDTITLLYGATVRARAFSGNSFADRFLESDVTTITYLSTTPKVATPQISPNGGTFNQGTGITINTSTPGATIRYRTDGRAPSFFYPGTEYTGPITLPPGTYEIVARGYKDGYYKSDAAYADEITITPVTLPSPTIYPNGGTFAGEATVYIGSTVLGAQIRYTLDGSNPTSSSPLFTEPIALTSSTTVKARIYLDGYSPSNIVTKSFTIIGQVAAPTFSPNSGTTANDSLQVTLATATAGATIRYTTNGAEPTSYSTAYTGPFNLGVGQHTVKARAFLPGADASSTATAVYTVYDTSVTLATPTIDPPGGNFNGPVTVTFDIDTEDVDFFFYTLDGTDPQSSASVQSYSGPFQLNGDDTYFIKVRAFKSGVGNSGIGSATLVVVNPINGPIQTPTISPSGG
ncbi:MAG: chitobiase/beta-hexosaminidase C-terminal domain-containing protein, partial [Anaerolineales bacterium]|nr:chitobiase/beta-hexosaminidase C-terminal domain-containing protein [Anaerolineales bacterium]